MSPRRILLRIMLFALAISAGVGAFLVMTSGTEVGGRVFGSGIALAITAGVLLPVSLMIDKPTTRYAGLFASAVIVVEFVGILSLMWEVHRLLGSTGEDRVAIAMLSLGLVAVPLTLCLWLVSQPITRVPSLVGFALWPGVLIVALIGCVLPGRSWEHDEWFMTAWSAGLYGMLVSFSLAGIGRRFASWSWRIAGVLTAIAGFAITDIGIWQRVSPDYPAFLLVTSLAVLFAHLSFCLLVPLRDGQRWARAIALIAALGTATALNIQANLLDEQSTTFARLAGACAIISACASLSLIVLAILNRKRERTSDGPPAIKNVQLICPECGLAQSVSTGDSSCGSCGMIFHIRIEDPSCPACDYSLLRFKGERCPECGAPVESRVPVPAPVPAGGAA